MIYRKIFLSELEAWEFAKQVVAEGGLVIDYGETFGGYYINYNSEEELACL